MFEILLVPVANVDRTILEFLSAALVDLLGVTCRVQCAGIDIEDTYHPTRQQYFSTQILAMLTKQPAGDRTKILGVADVDLFIPVLTFVFGEAQLGSRAALMSVYRLRQQFYGLPGDDVLFYQRCEKEAIHELGHTLGLVHCRNFECVMHFSNSIEQVDLKTNAFCGACAKLTSANLMK